MKIVVIGSNGQLGWEILQQGKACGCEMKGVDLPLVDITNNTQAVNLFTLYQPELVINAAAYTHVDGAETEKDLAFRVNRDAPGHLAYLCSTFGIPLIHFSTDYVFDGKGDVPYKETDPVSPVNVYGQSKLEGENRIRSELQKHIIIRTSWLYGIHGNNFVKAMLRLGKEKESVQVVADQFGSPTSTADLSESVLHIASHIQNRTNIAWGTYHYCGRGITTWHEFSQEIFDIAKSMTSLIVRQVEPIPSTVFVSKASRPAFSALDCQQIQTHFGIQTKPWRHSLKVMIHRFFNE